MSLDLSAAAAILKECYPKETVPELGYKDNPFFAVIKKDTTAGGDQEKIPLDVAPNQARSATFSTAQTLAAGTSSKFKAFELTLVEDYAVAMVTGKVLRITKNNLQAFVRAMDREVKNSFRASMRAANRDLYRDRTGAIGSVGASGLSTVYCTLTNATKGAGHCFEVGMEVVAAANATSSLRSGNATITGINRATGVLTTDSNWASQITSIADADLLFPQGDYVTASDKLKLAGLEAWCPATAPAPADSFYGVDRSIDVERLSGVRYDGSLDSLEEALINGQSEGSANGGKPSICLMAPYNMRRLINSLGSKKFEYHDVYAQGPDGPIAEIGFRAVFIQGDTGDIAILADPLVPYDVAWMIDPESWTLFSAGDFPGFLKEDGLEIRAVYNADAYECRIGGYLNAGCTDPSSTVRIKLA